MSILFLVEKLDAGALKYILYLYILFPPEKNGVAQIRKRPFWQMYHETTTVPHIYLIVFFIFAFLWDGNIPMHTALLTAIA